MKNSQDIDNNVKTNERRYVHTLLEHPLTATYQYTHAAMSSSKKKRYSTTNLLLSPVLTVSPGQHPYISSPSSHQRHSESALGLGINSVEPTHYRRNIRRSSTIYRIPRPNDMSSHPSSRTHSNNDEHTEPISNLKILLLGDSNVGKTAMILSYCNELLTKSQFKSQLISNNTKHMNSVSSHSSNGFKLDRLNKLKGRGNSKRFSLNESDLETLILKRRASIIRQKIRCRSYCFDRDEEDDEADLDYSESEQYGGYFGVEGSIDELGSPFVDAKASFDDREEMIIDTRPTIGIDIKSTLVNIQGKKYNCIFWDPAGQDRFKNVMMDSLYKISNAIILCYDICDLTSFQNCCRYWLNETLENVRSGDLSEIKFYLVGNKLDLYAKRQVNHEDVLNMITNMEYDYGITISGNFEVTCKWENVVERIFDLILMDLVEKGTSESTPAKENGNIYNPGSSTMRYSDDQHTPEIRNRFVKRLSVQELTPFDESVPPLEDRFSDLSIDDLNIDPIPMDATTTTKKNRKTKQPHTKSKSKARPKKNKEANIDITKPLDGSLDSPSTNSSACCY